MNKDIDMNYEKESSGTKSIFIIGIILFIIIGAGMSIPSAIKYFQKATYLNPTNFEDANTKFFKELAKNKLTIISPSSKDSLNVEQGIFKIAIVLLQHDLDHFADRDNKKAHANDTVLIFACYELLNGDKELGTKLLKLLKQHDSKIRYNYPTEKKGLLGDTGANIYIDELIQAADKFIKGDSSEKDVLERPASQYEWRKKEYGPKTISE